MSLTAESIFGSLLGTSTIQQNQQLIDLERQRMALNQQLIAQQSAQQTKSGANPMVIFGIIFGFIIIGALAYFFLFKK